MTIFYLVFGNKMEYHLQARFSMMSFRAQMTDKDRIIVVTTCPEYYQTYLAPSHLASRISIIPVTDDKIKEWEGKHHFFWRAKIKAMELIAENYPDDDMLYLDGDTFLYGDLNKMKDMLKEGHGLMDVDEGHPAQMKGKSLSMWNTVAGHTYEGITLSKEHHMWTAGVVAIPADKVKKVVSTALNICDGMLDDGAEPIVVEQYSLSIAMYELTKLREAKSLIAHYWSNKPAWIEKAKDVMLQSYLKNLSEEEELDLIRNLQLSDTPVYVHKSNTARRLKSLIDKLFKDKNPRYIAPNL